MSDQHEGPTGSSAGGPPLPLGASDAVAVETASAAWTYGEVASAADALADRLAALPARAGALKIGHAFDLSPEAIVTAHAVARAGAVLAPGHLGWSADQKARYHRTIDPDAVIVAAGHEWQGPWARAALSLPGFRPLDLLTPIEPGARGTAVPSGAEVLITTSGSGGKPRAVCHSWPALLANARAANDRSGAGPGSVTLATLAWAHIGGLAIILRAAESGSRIVCGPASFEPGAAVGALERHGVTHVSLVPVMLEQLVETGAGPWTLETALTGGAATSRRLLNKAIEAGWPVSLTYGLTEAGSQVATAPPGDVRAGAGALEHPLAGFEMRVTDDGELLVRGPSMLIGYLGGGPALDADGWFATGDMVARDDAGRLAVVGRATNRIVTGGTNVDPEDVEAVLVEREGVTDACVVGLPDERWGEIVAATVVFGGGAQPERRAEPETGSRLLAELEAWARDRFDGPRRPRRWRVVEALPRTATGKVDRSAVRRGWADEEIRGTVTGRMDKGSDLRC